jgi:hypothetical protein
MGKYASKTETNVPLFKLSGEVRYKHLRHYVINYDTHAEGIYNQGGITIAYQRLTDVELELILGSTEEPAIRIGFAGCSLSDNYDRKFGRMIAEQRLATSRDVIVGEKYIERILKAIEPGEVADVIYGPLAAQGIRFEACA